VRREHSTHVIYSIFLFLFSVFRLAALVVCCVGSVTRRGRHILTPQRSHGCRPPELTFAATASRQNPQSETLRVENQDGECTLLSKYSSEKCISYGAAASGVRNPWCETHTAYFLETTLSLRFIK
jgi:hypothetical protein